MRAICIPNIKIQGNESLKLTDDTHHHLKNVLRLSEKTRLLLLNGKGLRAEGTIEEITKKHTIIKVHSFERLENESRLDVFCAQVKKDAMDLVIKQACELKVRKLIIGTTDFSQRYELNEKRLKNLLTTSLEQSNNPYFPEIIVGQTLSELKSYRKVIYFDSVNTHKSQCISTVDESVIVLGPEGGFSGEELQLLSELDNSFGIHLNTAILRTSTALPCAIGYVLGAVSQK